MEPLTTASITYLLEVLSNVQVFPTLANGQPNPNAMVQTERQVAATQELFTALMNSQQPSPPEVEPEVPAMSNGHNLAELIPQP